MAYTEEDLIPLSYLSQHFYCPRRAGMLLIDNVWSDNQYTVEGSIIHERVHEQGQEFRSRVSRFTGLTLSSYQLGLSGKADCVEFMPSDFGNQVPSMTGKWIIIPIEYKHGKVRAEYEYEIQLCGQALCLEEMWNCRIDSGFIYYSGDHRRIAVHFSDALRNAVKEGAEALHKILRFGNIPSGHKTARCKKCSLNELCMPEMKTEATKYFDLWLNPEKWGNDR